MMHANGWEFRRYVTLLVVLALHMALLAALVLASRTRAAFASANQPIELLYMEPARLPKIRAENSRPPRPSRDTAIAIAPPVLDSLSSSLSPPASGSHGKGAGIDWAAEARRALQAFEIRSHQPPDNDSVSRSPAEDVWWPTPHKAGDQFKTPNGDWIVWINSTCYEVANSAALADPSATTLPQVVCDGEPRRPAGDLSDRSTANRKRDSNE